MGVLGLALGRIPLSKEDVTTVAVRGANGDDSLAAGVLAVG
jgi:hypothetical protein